MRLRLHAVLSLLGAALFTLALWVLWRELEATRYADLVQQLGRLPPGRIALAVLLTVLNYSVLTGYELFAFRYIGHPLRYAKIALAAFIGYTFSNNVGMAVVSGTSVRYRLYAAWGLSAVEIAQVVAFITLTFWLGLLALAGATFVLEPVGIPAALNLPWLSVRPLGVAFLAVVVGVIAWSGLRKAPLRFRELVLPLPAPHVALAQISLASLDLVLAGAVLYVLLPAAPAPSFPHFLGVYLLAELAGMASQVPGGLGVFETVMVWLLTPPLAASQVLAALVAYRVIYYLLPLAVSVVFLGAHEVALHQARFRRALRGFIDLAPDLVPNVLALLTVLAGAMLVFSGATPAISHRLLWLERLLPLPVLELSHFLGSLIGMSLLMLAWGLQRRLDAAYALTVALLAAGIGFSLLKGLDYEEALALAVVLGAFGPSRGHFHRRASLLSEPFSPGWLAAVAVIAASSVWLGLFSFKHVGYSHDLWWRFVLTEDAPRFLRASVGIVAFGLAAAFIRLLRPGAVRPRLPSTAELDRVRPIVEASRDTVANLAYLGDKAFLFSESGRAFLMYQVAGRSWVALGGPIGAEEEASELAWRFRELCDEYDGWTVFYGVDRDHLPLYLDLGLTLLKIGEEAQVALETFSLEGGEAKELRYAYRKLERSGCQFEVVPTDQVEPLLTDLRGISDAWLAEKQTREKSFSLGRFDPAYLRRFPMAVARLEGRVIAFANVWCGGGNAEVSIDLMRHLPSAPNGIMDYLFIALMQWGQSHGYRWFNLGMAPLSGLQDRALAPLWARVGAAIYRHGEHFYNFQGLRQYKAKFHPRWEPKYLALPGGFALPSVLTHIAALTSGGVSGILGK